MPQDLHRKTAAAAADGSDSDTSGAGGAAKQQQNSGVQHTAKGPAAGSDDDGDGDGDGDGNAASDLDDETMLKLDAQLAAAVRASLNRGGGSAKERAAALLALQLRVASLLEDWLKKVRV